MGIYSYIPLVFNWVDNTSIVTIVLFGITKRWVFNRIDHIIVTIVLFGGDVEMADNKMMGLNRVDNSIDGRV